MSRYHDEIGDGPAESDAVQLGEDATADVVPAALEQHAQRLRGRRYSAFSHRHRRPHGNTLGS